MHLLRDPAGHEFAGHPGFMVKLPIGLAVLLLPMVALAPACAAAPGDAAPGQPVGAREGDAVTGARTAISRRFPNLDAYLAFLEKRSHLDGAWYRQVRPGVYELQTGNLRLSDGAKRQRIFTREELEKKFGFSR
jgi:hypothetical protein